MRSFIRTGVAVLVVATSAAVSAQTPQRLIGFTNTGNVLMQDVVTCSPSGCNPLGIGAPTNPFWGGTAYDPTTRSAWISDGLLLAKVDPRTPCTPTCPVLPFPNTSPNNPVTGLAFNEVTNTVFVTDASGVIRWYSVAGGCQLSIIGRCIAPVPLGMRLTGCATDDVQGRIFYCATNGVAGGMVFVAPQTNPCAVVCSFPVTTCGANLMGPLQGLAFDPCTSSVWATDGRLSTQRPVSASCAVGPELQCCVNPTLSGYTGLCLVPATEASAGVNCQDASCATCPTMEHSLFGDPTIGNPSFALALEDAPSGSSAFLFFNIGACTGPGVLSPPLCGPLLVPVAPPPGSFGPLPVPGVGCGDIVVPVTLPLFPAICGLTFSTQWVGICPTGGTFSTNCVSWTISGT